MTQEPKPGPLAPLANPNYRLLLTGHISAMFGMSVQQVANLWQVYELTGSALQLGLTGLFQAIPMLTLGLFGGALADAMDRRKLIYISQGVRFLAVLYLTLLTVAGLTEVWHIYLVTLVSSFSALFDRPARQALVASIVPRDLLFGATSLQMTSNQLSRLAGPSIAGVLLALYGTSATYIALTVITSLGILTLLPMRVTYRDERKTRFSMQMVWEGARFYLSTSLLVGLGAVDLGVTLFTAFRPLMPIFAEEILHVGPAGLGMLMSAPAFGSLAGAAVVTMLAGYKHRGRLVFFSTFAYGLLIIPLGYCQVFVVSLLLVATLGFLDSVGATIRSTNVQMFSPDHLRGRVTSMHLTVAGGGTSLGNAEIGIMASFLGPGHALALGGALCMVTTGLVALWWRAKVPAEHAVLARSETGAAP